MLKSETKVDVGQILDISEGGLSFQYVVNDDKLRDYSTFGISKTGAGFFSINRIPFKTISDTELTNRLPSSPTKLRRHSLKFDKLTSRQLFKIEYFLSNYIACQT